MTANLPDIELIPGETLIFLDEIQRCGNARTAVKFLAEDMRFLGCGITRNKIKILGFSNKTGDNLLIKS